MPRLFALCLVPLIAVHCCGCAAQREDRLKRAAQIQYSDRDGDGKIDREFHRYPGFFDVDWELLDDNHDGRYEKKIVYGYTLMESDVDLPVPKQQGTN